MVLSDDQQQKVMDIFKLERRIARFASWMYLIGFSALAYGLVLQFFNINLSPFCTGTRLWAGDMVTGMSRTWKNLAPWVGIMSDLIFCSVFLILGYNGVLRKIWPFVTAALLYAADLLIYFSLARDTDPSVVWVALVHLVGIIFIVIGMMNAYRFTSQRRPIK